MNRWQGIGNLTRDPELSYTQGSQTAKCVFTIACNRPKRNGEDQGADYIRVVTWGKRAETCDRYLSKGSKVGICGSIHTGSYKDREGKTVYTTDVWADEVEFVQTHARNPYVEHTSNPLIQEQRQQAAQEAQMEFGDLPDSFAAAEDDIPF